MSGRTEELVRALIGVLIGCLFAWLLMYMFLHSLTDQFADLNQQNATGEETLVTSALYTAARAVVEQGYHFESESAIQGWRDGLNEVRQSTATRFPCMDDRVCSREEWLIDAIRHFGTLAFESGSTEPVASWTLNIRNAVDDLEPCLHVSLDRDKNACDVLATKALSFALSPPAM